MPLLFSRRRSYQYISSLECPRYMSFLNASSNAFGHCNFAKFDRNGVQPADIKADSWSCLLQLSRLERAPDHAAFPDLPSADC